jgi:hypothetical protein
LAKSLADRAALDLTAHASAVWPVDFLCSSSIVAERLCEIGLVFAVNARRVLEMKSLNAEMGKTLWEYKDELRPTSASLKDALNGIIHSRSLRVNYARYARSPFSDQEGWSATHFIFTTDRYPETFVPIYGLAHSYLKLLSERT